MIIADLAQVEYFPADKPWEDSNGRFQLLGSSCPECSAKAFPPRKVCHRCGNTAGIERVPLPNRGRLYSFTKVHVAPPGFETPYIAGYVDLEGDVRIFTQLEGDGADLQVDTPVELVLGKVRSLENGTPVMSVKFRKV